MSPYLNQLTTADCLGPHGMGNLLSGSVDFICADLPFGTTRNKWDSPLSLPALWQEYTRLLKPGGVVALFAQTPFDKVLGASNLPWLRYEWVWEKTAATGHFNARVAPLKAHENILIFYQQRGTFHPQKTTGHPRQKVTAAASNKARPSSNYDEKYQNNRTADYDSTERFPRSVLRFASDRQQSNLHATQKPLALLEYLVLTYTNPGELVLDNTMGSGSLAVAAEDNGRDWIGFEQDPQIADTARQRLAAHRISSLLWL